MGNPIIHDVGFLASQGFVPTIAKKIEKIMSPYVSILERRHCPSVAHLPIIISHPKTISTESGVGMGKKNISV